ncbi:MAG TPA: response regulator [Gemmatimonadales bacterium]
MTTPIRILVVDDEAPVRRTLERALGRKGHTVIVASSGEAACSVLTSQQVDAVLLDLRMPTMSGQTLYHVILTQWPQLADKVIVMSGDPEAGDHGGWLELYDLPVVPKPFELQSVYTAIDDLVAGRRNRARGD